MSNNDVPIWEKYTLTIEEASKYFALEKTSCGGLPRKTHPLAG